MDTIAFGSARQKVLVLSLLSVLLQSCIGTAVGTAVDVTLEVAKVPFKVAGAVVDVATPEEDDED